MIDIHAHIIPYVDDGAEDLGDALLMADLAVESGVHTIIATPHSNIPGIDGNYRTPGFLQHFLKFQKALGERGIPLRILNGMEIFATSDIAEKIRDKRLMSLNDSGHYLIEFDFHMKKEEITQLLERVCDAGAIPIVAHPERYICVQKKPQAVMEWIDMGCQLQMNKGSIFGSFGKGSFRAANELLYNDCITYIASDAHSPYRRTTYMKDIQEYLQEEFSMRYAEKILVENPQRFLIERTV